MTSVKHDLKIPEKYLSAMKSQETGLSSDSPLQTLYDQLESDMEKVNDCILENMHSKIPLIPQLAEYLVNAGGKRIRPLLTLACTRLHGGSMQRGHGLAAAVEFIHSATLLHDDVVDDSSERRGKPSANTIFGNEASVLVGDFLFSRAFQLMVKDGSLETLRILSDAAATIAEGEVHQLTTQNNLDTTLDDYLNVIAGKTAALFAAACEVGPVIASAPAEATRYYGWNLGMAFQIVDDVLDFSAKQEQLGKSIGDDFAEGKMTAPILFALEKANSEERSFWLRTLGDKNQTAGDLAQAQAYIHKHQGFERSIQLAEKYIQEAHKALESMPKTELYDTLDALLLFTLKRLY